MLFALQLPLVPEDANCKPEGLVFNTHLFWTVSALSKGPRAVAGLRGITSVRESGKERMPEKCAAAAGKKARQKDAHGGADAEQCPAWETLPKL